MKIDVLYFESCPVWQRTARDVRRILAEAHLEADAEVRLVTVATEEDAQRLRFLGSPTVRVDDVDVDPEGGGATTFGLQCRVYEHNGRLQPSPPGAWIRTALDVAARRPT